MIGNGVCDAKTVGSRNELSYWMGGWTHHRLVVLRKQHSPPCWWVVLFGVGAGSGSGFLAKTYQERNRRTC